MRYWRIGTRPRDRSDDWWSPMKKGGFVALGYSLGEDLSAALARGPDPLPARISREHPDWDDRYVAALLKIRERVPQLKSVA